MDRQKKKKEKTSNKTTIIINEIKYASVGSKNRLRL